MWKSWAYGPQSQGTEVAGCICICHGNEEFGEFVGWRASFPRLLVVGPAAVLTRCRSPPFFKILFPSLFLVMCSSTYTTVSSKASVLQGCFKGFGWKPESLFSSHFCSLCCHLGKKKEFFMAGGIVAVSGGASWMWVCIEVHWEISPKQITLFHIAKAELKLVIFFLPLLRWYWLGDQKHQFWTQLRLLRCLYSDFRNISDRHPSDMPWYTVHCSLRQGTRSVFLKLFIWRTVKPLKKKSKISLFV